MWRSSRTGTGQEGRKTVEKQKSSIFNPDGDSHSVGRRIEGDANSRLFFQPLSH